VSKIVQSASSQALCRSGRFRAPGLFFQIGAPPLRYFFRNPDHEQAHQIAMRIGNSNPKFFRLSHLLRKQRVQLQRFALHCPIHRSGLSAGQRVTASRSTSRNASPVQVAQIRDR
jgi:hypothetical protein